MAYKYLVPSDTERVLQQHEDRCLNMGLILARYIPHEAVRNDDNHDDHGRAIGKVRTDWLSQVLRRFNGGNLSDMLSANFNRWIALTEDKNKIVRFEMRARGRVIIGLGGKGPLEFGITLHPVTGLPYIPGSALKGLCRSYALQVLASRHQVDIEERALQDFDEALMLGKQYTSDEAVHYRRIFGSQTEAGGCVFYEAILSDLQIDTPIFTVEVMTPHFTDYYTSSGSKPPDDGGNPNPVSFIAVSHGVMFAFAIGTRAKFNDPDSKALKQARRWLRDGLQELGVGAKTASGYGVFEPTRA